MWRLALACTRPGAARRPPDGPEAPTVEVHAGEDWSLPARAPAPESGFTSERRSDGVDVRVVDVTWAQLEPAPGRYVDDLPGGAQGMDFPPLADQYPGGPVWVRIWTSGVGWAPDWLGDVCGVTPISGVDDDGQRHWPIWDRCVWGRIRDLYAEVLVRRGLLADPDVKYVYVPGAFDWCEFDAGMVDLARERDGLDAATWRAWFREMVGDLAELGGEHAGKLVYTGEDHPWGGFPGDDLDARDAVAAGLGVRSGITELANLHLSDTPAYGIRLADDGHLVVDEGWPTAAGRAVVAAENECFDGCGLRADDLGYALRVANWKALQLRTRWLYVVPGPSHLADEAAHWAWVRAELGHTAATAPDAWVVLRDAEDRYWAELGTGPSGARWEGFPYVKNLERWLVQRDAGPDCVSRRGTDRHEGELHPENGVAHEGRRPDPDAGADGLCFDVDPAFRDGPLGPLDVLVTFRDRGAPFALAYTGPDGPGTTPDVVPGGTGALRTATFHLPDVVLAGAFAGGTDFRLVGPDVEAWVVRIVPR